MSFDKSGRGFRHWSSHHKKGSVIRLTKDIFRFSQLIYVPGSGTDAGAHSQ